MLSNSCKALCTAKLWFFRPDIRPMLTNCLNSFTFFAIWFSRAQISETFFNTNDHNQVTLKLHDVQILKIDRWGKKILAIQALFHFKSIISSIAILEDPLWSTGQDTRLPNGRSVVQIRCSVNAFELTIWIDQKPTIPSESCGSSTC